MVTAAKNLFDLEKFAQSIDERGAKGSSTVSEDAIGTAIATENLFIQYFGGFISITSFGWVYFWVQAGAVNSDQDVSIAIRTR